MNLRKLIPMTCYVNQVLAYVEESKNHETGIALIKWYSELIHQPIQIDMFISNNPLFPNFHFVESQTEALRNNRMQSVFYFGENKFGVTLYRKSKHASNKSGMAFITSYHLKTVKDLCDMDISFNNDSDYAESDLFD